MNAQIAQLAASGNWDLILPANPDRTYLEVSGDTAAAVFVWIGSNPPTTNAGIALGTFTPVQEWTRHKIGELITQPIYVHGTLGKIVTAIEGFS